MHGAGTLRETLAVFSVHELPASRLLCLAATDDVERGQLELPERVLRELQAEAAVMSRMRHPK